MLFSLGNAMHLWLEFGWRMLNNHIHHNSSKKYIFLGKKCVFRLNPHYLSNWIWNRDCKMSGWNSKRTTHIELSAQRVCVYVCMRKRDKKRKQDRNQSDNWMVHDSLYYNNRHCVADNFQEWKRRKKITNQIYLCYSIHEKKSTKEQIHNYCAVWHTRKLFEVLK